MHFINKIPFPTVTEKAIQGFFADYRWLSNFHPCIVKVDDYEFGSSEHAYMAQKTHEHWEKKMLCVIHRLSAKEAKLFGQKVTLRPDWEEVKLSEMKRVVKAKFEQNKDLTTELLNTGDKYLEETNYWNDTYWGVCRGVGTNHLGVILMEVRDELRKEKLNP